jgi:hypothetical protein
MQDSQADNQFVICAEDNYQTVKKLLKLILTSCFVLAPFAYLSFTLFNCSSL